MTYEDELNEILQYLKEFRAEEVINIVDSDGSTAVITTQCDPSRGCPGQEQLDYSLYEQVAIAARKWTLGK